MTQEFTVALTDEQAAQLRELAAHWRESLQETLRRVAVDGLDMALQIKAHDEDEAAGRPRPDRRRHTTNKLDNDIPY